MDIQLPTKVSKISFSANDNGHQYTIFEAVLLVIVGILFFMFILQPKRAELVAAQEREVKLEEQNRKVQKNKATLLSLIKELKNHPEQISELDEALPLESRITRYRIAIESLVANSGMKIGDVSIETGPDRPAAGNKGVLANPFGQVRKLQKFNTNITVAGTFEQFIGLLKKLETSGRVIDVNSIEVRSSKEDSLEFRITSQSYFYE